MAAVLDIPDAQKSRIQALRDSNENPVGQERKDITDFSATLRQASDDFASRIVALRSELAGIEEEKTLADALLDDIAAILHPIRSLPQEVLSEIFNAALQLSPTPTVRDFVNPAMVDSLHRSYPAWVLSKVCSRWRTAALGTGNLWSTVILALDSDHWQDNAVNISFLLSTFLSRSGNRAISVRLGSKRQSAFQNHPTFPTLLMTCHRWELAYIYLPTNDYVALESVPGPFSILKTIQLPFDAMPPPNRIYNAFMSSQAPQLSQIVTNISDGLLHFNLPWSQIHTFRHFGNMQTEDANLQLFRTMSSVQTLQLIAAPVGLTPIRTTTTPITLSKLRTLSVTGKANKIRAICGYIHAPELTSLTLKPSASRLENALVRGTPLAFRTTTCRHLALCMQQGDEIEVDALVWLLHELPGIVRLEIEIMTEGWGIGDICEALTSHGRETVGAGLESITLVGSHGFSVDERLITMIVSRRADHVDGEQVLKGLVLRGVKDCSDDVMTGLAQLSSTGLEVTITHL